MAKRVRAFYYIYSYSFTIIHIDPFVLVFLSTETRARKPVEFKFLILWYLEIVDQNFDSSKGKVLRIPQPGNISNDLSKVFVFCSHLNFNFYKSLFREHGTF